MGTEKWYDIQLDLKDSSKPMMSSSRLFGSLPIYLIP